MQGFRVVEGQAGVVSAIRFSSASLPDPGKFRGRVRYYLGQASLYNRFGIFEHGVVIVLRQTGPHDNLV